MIYLIQPKHYPPSLYRLLRNIIEQTIPQETLIVQHDSNISTINNLYFIIYDSQIPTWNGLTLARAIRQQDRLGHLILISNVLDYQTFFRSHIGFLDVLDNHQISCAELESYLILVKNQNLTSLTHLAEP
ncbi:hypothetical protein GGG87_03875 [Streptococcus sp. zg-86]|uniref:Response regulator n=1 Tax=Streptococcus zhangguiae TaxID=2664091 RepID=A0A6I4R9H3_9STRE|nr:MULTISPECIES: hypothetical protein [unclassified Streptococcus]MTB64141.1 hypothetical protein [Streptococcus sp. zg-86]MTB90533.1 hypothetical protein [Streptococcus sp. zg-36]MWV56129.1 hypothetical protein [Streptococcus sp. zg-70]QTH48247.1 hypothetical protein J5M87_02645 [Streptococcus sp. zg-86]